MGCSQDFGCNHTPGQKVGVGVLAYGEISVPLTEETVIVPHTYGPLMHKRNRDASAGRQERQIAQREMIAFIMHYEDLLFV